MNIIKNNEANAQMNGRNISQLTADKRPRITADMVKNSKSIKCECGSYLFRSAIVFKKLSHLITFTNNDELVPIEVFVCDKCGKINKDLMKEDVIGDLE